MRYVLLHDDHEGATDIAKEKFQQNMIAILGKDYCSFLKINSLSSLEKSVQEGVTMESYLSREDWEEMEKFTISLYMQVVLPQLTTIYQNLKSKVKNSYFSSYLLQKLTLFSFHSLKQNLISLVLIFFLVKMISDFFLFSFLSSHFLSLLFLQ